MMRKNVLLLVALLLLAAPSISGADAAAFCSNLFTGGNVLPGGTSVTTLLSISLILMLIMLIIAGMLYAIGYAIKVDKLVRFAKSEIGEVVITLLIVFVFLGAFAVTSVSTPGNFLAIGKGTFGSGIYMYDCEALYSTSLGMVVPIIELIINEMVVSFLASVQVTIQPVFFGVAFSPWAGLTVVNSVIKMMLNITGAFFGLLLATMFVLLIVYKLFPLFFFAGIVLRTIPWTRAAGGAFLGMFVGFFIVLPLMLYVFTSSFTVSAPVASSSSYSSLVSGSASASSFSSVTGTLTQLQSIVESNTKGSGILIGFIRSVMEPSLFYVISVVLSFIISYNFMEVLGDLLGAQSLSSSRTLKRLL
ncbi:MAG: hypothetical protein ACP5UH_00115 [Candidatus Micrarchaeia archaeon]